MSSRPILIFIPGAGHIAETWSKVTTLLEEQGFKCVALTNPTTTGDASKSFGDDVTAARDAITAETSQGRNVVVVVHSYGGVIGQSAIKGLTAPKEGNSSSSSSGYVIGLAMMATGFGVTGTTFLGGLGGKPPPSWELDPSGFSIVVVPERELFYHDLPEEEGDLCVSKLTKQSSRAFTEGAEFAYAGWKDVPVWYLVTTEDKALPVAVQTMMLQMARDGGGDITVKEIDSSHSPMLSRPKETAKFILDAVASFQR